MDQSRDGIENGGGVLTCDRCGSKGTAMLLIGEDRRVEWSVPWVWLCSLCYAGMHGLSMVCID